LQLFVSFVGLTICRVLFHIFNLSSFNDIGFAEYGTGALYDLFTIGIFFLPYYCFYLIPFHRRDHKLYILITKTLFHLTNTLIICLNLIDVEFFKFTSKRSGYDVVEMMSYGSDFQNLLGSFITDYWYLILIAIILVVFSEWALRKIGTPDRRTMDLRTLVVNFTALIILAPLLFIMGRGGLGVRPVSILFAGNLVPPQNVSFSLNTAFTFIKSINDVPLEEKNYFTKKEVKQLFDPIQATGSHAPLKNQNVVLIIMESFSQEFIGTYSGNESYTPFIDSLITKSYYFTNSWANGKRSIEAVPAIISSIPGLISTPYISSNYSGNDATSIPRTLNEFGYESYFFHGATNGSMNFDAYAKMTGYDHYIGRTEYNNEKHFDGNWGIFDEYFLPWMADELPENSNTPFFSTIFSLSSHHPYKIPEHHQFKFKEGPEPIFKVVNYSDYSLKLFFEKAKTKDWYDHTLFIITADHTADSKDQYYGQRKGQYAIPLIFFHPNDTILKGKSERLAQQIDIMPSVFDLILPEERSIYSLGKSLFSDSSKNYAVNYGNGVFYYYEGDYLLIVSKDKPEYLLNYKTDKTLRYNIIEVNKDIPQKMFKNFKALLQTYTNDMIHNNMMSHE
jgi:phosphoglycerol transferase MdoB-like AlkP superfamily enzyme